MKLRFVCVAAWMALALALMGMPDATIAGAIQCENHSLNRDDQSHEVELSFDKRTPLQRAEILAARALNIYADPDSRLPGCEIAGFKDRALVDVHRGDALPAGSRAVHLTLSSDGVIESIFLDDVQVVIEFPADRDGAAKPQASCWNDAVVVS
jgi:hypothetical protein